MQFQCDIKFSFNFICEIKNLTWDCMCGIIEMKLEGLNQYNVNSLEYREWNW